MRFAARNGLVLRHWAVLFWALVGAGCDCGRPVTCRPSSQLPGGADLVGGARMVRVGQRVEFEAHLSSFCNGPAVRATQAQLTIVDPDNRSGRGQATFTAPIQPFSTSEGHESVAELSSMVAFTPDVPGRWTVTVRFDPSLGDATFPFEAVAFRAPTATRIVDAPALPADCAQLGVTSAGTALCGRAGQLITGRGQTLEGVSFAVRGDAVWRLTGDAGFTLERWEDDGGTLALTHRAASRGERVVATDDAAWALVPTPFDAFTGTRPTLIEQARPLPDGGLDVIAREAPEVLEAGALAVGPAGVTVFGSNRAQYFFQLLPSDGGEGTRRPVPFQFSDGVEEGTVWLRDQTKLTAAPSGISTLDGPLELSRRPQSLTPYAPAIPLSFPQRFPDAETAYTFPALGPGGITWDGIESPPGFFPARHATRELAFARSRDGGQVAALSR